MAIYTPLGPADAQRLADAHALGEVLEVVGVPAGSVNSNFLLYTAAGTVFARIYEEQGAEGVAYEWALLEHLSEGGVEVPWRVAGPGPGALLVRGKPTAVFALVEGEELCQARVDLARVEAVGAALARAHLVGRSFDRRRAGRFGLREVRVRLDSVAALARPELAEDVHTLSLALDEVEAGWVEGLPSGVIHGDLFRDNVRWAGSRIAGLLDWESASDGLFVYDLAVTLLAWCFGDAMRWDLAGGLTRAYAAVRPLEERERAFLRTALMAAAARFATTRITDYHLRAEGAQIKRDYRRFLARLSEVRAADLEAALG